MAVLSILASTTASADLITEQLYNTGLDNAGNLVNNASHDVHWNVAQVTNGLIGLDADAITYKHSAYAANDNDSQWISSNASGGIETTSSTDYFFSTTFDLTGYDANTAMITGSWGVDNYASIFLNGNDTGVALDFGSAAFNSLNSFSLSDFFIDGINTLTVNVTNGYTTNLSADPGPMAMRFDNLQLTASNTFASSASVPEPSTFAIFALGMIGLASRRFKKQS